MHVRGLVNIGQFKKMMLDAMSWHGPPMFSVNICLTDLVISMFNRIAFHGWQQHWSGVCLIVRAWALH